MTPAAKAAVKLLRETASLCDYCFKPMGSEKCLGTKTYYGQAFAFCSYEHRACRKTDNTPAGSPPGNQEVTDARPGQAGL